MPGSIYGLFVGVTAYPAGISGLEFCGADATGLYEFFAKHTSRENLKLLTQYGDRSGFVTSDQVIKALNDFSSRQLFTVEDLFLFFFAGHGCYIKKEFYLLTSDSTLEPANIAKCSLPIELLKEHIDKISAGKQVMIIDACREHIGSRSAVTANMDRSTKKVLAELAKPRKIKVQEKQYHILRATISSCWLGQLSWEYPEVGHGWFSYHLLKSLREAPGPRVELGLLNTMVTERMRRTDEVSRVRPQESNLWLDGGQIFLPSTGPAPEPTQVCITPPPPEPVSGTYVAIAIAVFLAISLAPVVPWGHLTGPATLPTPIPTSHLAPTPTSTPIRIPPDFASQIALAKQYRGDAAYFDACKIYAKALNSLSPAVLTDSDREAVSQADKCGQGTSQEIVEQLNEIADKLLAKRPPGIVKAHH